MGDVMPVLEPSSDTFRVLRGDTVVLRTGDWVEAETAALTPWPHNTIMRVRGTHPTHEWTDGRCTACGAWDNGSYGSHAPCGYDWSHDSLVSALERERAARNA